MASVTLIALVAAGLPRRAVPWRAPPVSRPACAHLLRLAGSRGGSRFVLFEGRWRPGLAMASRPIPVPGNRGDDMEDVGTHMERDEAPGARGQDEEDTSAGVVEVDSDIGVDAEPLVFDSSSIQVLEEVTWVPSKLGIVAQWLQTFVTGSKEPLYTAPAPNRLIPVTGTLPASLNVTTSSFLPGGRISSITALPAPPALERPRSTNWKDLRGAGEDDGATRLGVNNQVPDDNVGDSGGGGESEAALEKRPANTKRDDGDSGRAFLSSRELYQQYQPQSTQEMKSSLPRDLWRIRCNARKRALHNGGTSLHSGERALHKI